MGSFGEKKMSDYEYEMREAREHHRAMSEVEKAPLSERKEAAAEFLDAMANHPDVVGERVGWLLDGNYGYGSMKTAERVMAMSKRANKLAMLTQMVGALEWRCPVRMEMAAWKKLTPAQKAALDREVQRAMDDWKASR